MESVCDKPQAARTRGPKIRVVGAIRVDNPQAGRAECRGKAFQARLRPSLVFHSSFILHFSLFTLHLSNGLCLMVLCIVL